MSKYIDADRLLAEIEKERKKALDSTKRGGLTISDIAVADVLAEVLLIIEQLKKEQPDFPATDEQIKEFLATHPKIEVPEKYKNPDWLFKKQEQPEVDLEKEIDRLWESFADEMEGPHNLFDMYQRLARHFAEWGYLRATEKYNEVEYNRQMAEESIPNELEEAAWQYAEQEVKTWGSSEPDDKKEVHDDFIAGAKWQKEQMMKEAVEGEVYLYHGYKRDATAILVDIPKESLGEKVRIIVCKKED